MLKVMFNRYNRAGCLLVVLLVLTTATCVGLYEVTEPQVGPIQVKKESER